MSDIDRLRAAADRPATNGATMSDWFHRLFLRAQRRHRWCACGDSRSTGTHSATECGPLPWGF